LVPSGDQAGQSRYPDVTTEVSAVSPVPSTFTTPSFCPEENKRPNTNFDPSGDHDGESSYVVSGPTGL